MKLIVTLAVVSILALKHAGLVPDDAVGGSLMLALVVLVGSLAIGVHEAAVARRGMIGWVVNLVVAFLGAFFTAQIGGILVMIALSPFLTERSLAATGGLALDAGLALLTAIALAGSWGALQIVNKFR